MLMHYYFVVILSTINLYLYLWHFYLCFVAEITKSKIEKYLNSYFRSLASESYSLENYVTYLCFFTCPVMVWTGLSEIN